MDGQVFNNQIDERSRLWMSTGKNVVPIWGSTIIIWFVLMKTGLENQTETWNEIKERASPSWTSITEAEIGSHPNQVERYDHLRFRHDRVKRVSNSLNIRQREKQILDKILGRKVYDNRIRPVGGNATSEKSNTVVKVNTFIRSINDIDDYKMEFSVQITFREQWNDMRLKFDDAEGRFRYLTLTDPGKVWMPDTFFRNEKHGHFHSILVNNVYVRVFPNGDVLYSIRISLTLSCPMNLKLYPMDRQTCSIKVASYGYTTDDILYLWKSQEPVQIAKNLSLPRFNIENHSASYCTVKTNTGEYSCLSVDLIFKRQFSYYLITIYVPGCMLVIVSWVSFWLDPHAVPARVALGVTTLLTMSTQTASINSALPPVAYTKAIDVWQGVCVTFVFSALLEYALVNYALRADRSYLMRKAALRNRRSSDDMGPIAMGLDDDDNGGMFFHNDDHEDDAELENSNHIPHAHVVEMNHISNLGTRFRNSRTNLLLNPFGTTNGNGSFLPKSSVTLLTSRLNGNGNSKEASTDTKTNNPQESSTKKKYPMEKAKRIDVCSRFFFPAVFAVFNVAYWFNYLLQARQEFLKTQKRMNE